jgi:hypothetical protein
MHRTVLAFAVAAVAALLLATNPAAAQDTPGVFCEEAKQTTGRVFPEAMESTDFVSYFEARCGLSLLEKNHPDYMDVHDVGESEGWHNYVSGSQDHFGVPVVEVTNENSEVPFEEKPKVLFMLSIHGNEKGGREGGLRVIEDLVRDRGLAQEHPRLRSMLDEMVVLFLFPNPDGWAHEMAQYRANDACYLSATCEDGDNANQPGAETQNFVRVNGNGVDLNREAATVGWQRESHTALSEPAPQDFWPALKAYENLRYASDIHGMLHPADSGVLFESGSPPVACVGSDSTPLPASAGAEVCLREGHFVLTMLPAGQQTPREITMSTRLAQDIEERLNGNDHFTEWNSAPEGGVWGGEYNSWGTVWDTIGYVDSGFSSDWFAQDTGLNVPGVDFELAYNHVTFDNYYPGLSQRINDYHVETVRTIVTAFMDHTARQTDVDLASDEGAETIGWVPTDTRITEDDEAPPAGWAAENPADDAVERGKTSYTASPNQFFQNLSASTDGETRLERVPADQLPDRLDDLDRLAVAGSAVDPILEDDAAKAGLEDWVESGGTLFVTDDALQLLPHLGVADEGAVEMTESYAGHTNFVDRDHPLAEDVRGMARQTYEPVPLGFSLEDGGNAPIWHVSRDAYDGEVAGVAGFDQGGTPVPDEVNLGQASLGDGTVAFLGALLPDPSTEFYHPYGLDGYATTYTGKQIAYNALGLEKNVTTAAAEVVEGDVTYDVDPGGDEPTRQAGAEGADDAGGAVPGPGLLGVLAGAGAALVARRRR